MATVNYFIWTKWEFCYGFVAVNWSTDEAIKRELWSQIEQVLALPGIHVCGLMTMAPQSDDPEVARPVFRRLRLLRDELAIQAHPHVRLTELSMGMSGDFAIAIEEGATLIRIGSRLFARP